MGNWIKFLWEWYVVRPWVYFFPFNNRPEKAEKPKTDENAQSPLEAKTRDASQGR